MSNNKIKQLFERKKGRILSVYFTTGYPQLNDTGRIMKALQKAGADIIEVGIPFSDPVADGPTIQQSNATALKNGITLRKIFEQLAEVKNEMEIPVILMGYVNPVLQFGVEAFCEKCAETGVSGLIIPDLPMQEYLDEYKGIVEKHGLINIFLITPQTSDERIREIDGNSRGFIYTVSSASTTGAKSGISHEQRAYFERIKAMNLRNPVLIGFGISNRETFHQACEYAPGAIIGSAFIKALDGAKNIERAVVDFVKSVKG